MGPAGRLAHDLHHIQQPDQGDVQATLLAGLADRGGRQRLAQLDAPTGEGPEAGRRVPAAPDEHDPPARDDDRADADAGRAHQWPRSDKSAARRGWSTRTQSER